MQSSFSPLVVSDHLSTEAVLAENEGSFTANTLCPSTKGLSGAGQTMNLGDRLLSEQFKVLTFVIANRLSDISSFRTRLRPASAS